MFQPAYSKSIISITHSINTLGSPFNVVETCWAQLKREYFVRLHRRDADILSMAQFRAMIKAVYEEVPINSDSLLRVNR